MKKPITLLIAICYFYSLTLAQTGDCSFSQNIESKNTIEIFFDDEGNNINDSLNACPGSENPIPLDGNFLTYWLSWTIQESGTLTFKLSKEDDIYDLDFFVFRVTNTESPCSQLDPVRCMLSGETQGSDSEPCMGATGLSFEEEDLYENSGCNNNSNNYVRYIDAIAGEEYRLAILNFDQNNDNPVKIEFCGTALLGEEDESCEESPNSTVVLQTTDPIEVFPNPTYDLINISNLDKWDVGSKVNVLDIFGNNILSFKSDTSSGTLDVFEFSTGIYYLRISNMDKTSLTSFVKM